MAKPVKRLKLTEIREIAPVADVYELHPNCKYLVFLKKSAIALDQNADLMQKGKEIMRIMAAFQIPCAIFVGSLENVQIVELKAEKV